MPAKNSQPSNPAAAPKILLVDDHEQNNELLEAYLEDVNAKVRIATDGLECLKAVEAEKPDLILLDVMMPRMSGFQVCKRLKGSANTKDISIIMVTALNEVSDVERATECGADDFLTKPVHKPDLLAKVRAVLAKRAG